jgi:hypothetical protein
MDAISESSRDRYDSTLAELVGRRLLSVTYWDTYNFGPASRQLLYGDWHLASMGVGLLTDGGPVAVMWTDTFGLYGVEFFLEPIENRLWLGEEGPEQWNASDDPAWVKKVDSPIRAASAFWDDASVGEQRLRVPFAVRLDFDEGPVWMVAASPHWPEPDPVFVGGDDIMVIFSTARMRSVGFPDAEFIAQPIGDGS